MQRRGFLCTGLAAGVGLAGAGLVAGCQSSTAPGAATGSGAPIQWWDNILGNDQLADTIFKQYTDRTGIPVEYTQVQAGRIGQSLQLAFQSDQLPEVFTNTGLDVPFLGLVEAGWFQPLQLTAEADALIPAEDRVEGINSVDGKLYTFPVTGSRLYNANIWHNTELLDKAGVEPPTTYDELRDACARIKAADPRVRGLLLNNDAAFQLTIDNGAQTAGFEGISGVLFRTGEARWHDDSYVEFLEFLLSLYRDGHVVEGKFNSDDARARFLVGQSMFLLDGIWTVASARAESEGAFIDKLGVSGPLTRERGQTPTVYRNQTLGGYMLSGQCDRPAEVSSLLAMFATPEYSRIVARGMFQTPPDPAQLDDPEVLPVFRDQVKKAVDNVFMAPQVARKSPELAQTMSKQKAVKPGIIEIFQGLLSGQLTDVRAELKKLSDATNASREAAATAGGIGIDDISFPNWQPRQDYTQEMYQT